MALDSPTAPTIIVILPPQKDSKSLTYKAIELSHTGSIRFDRQMEIRPSTQGGIQFSYHLFYRETIPSTNDVSNPLLDSLD